MGIISEWPSKIYFRNPEKSRVVIFDSSGSDIIRKAVLYNIPHTILPLSREIFYLSLTLMIFMTKNIRVIIDVIIKPTGKSRLKNFILHVYRLYYLACLEYIRPRVVITFIDNSDLFQWLSRKYKKAEFYAIQNGLRLKWDVTSSFEYSSENKGVTSMPHFFCFSPYVKDLYHQYDQEVDNYYPVGSIKAGYYKQVLVKNELQGKHYEICLISEWRYDYYLEGNLFPEIKHTLDILFEYLKKYIYEHELPLCIATKSADKISIKREITHYRKIFGDKVEITTKNENEYATYEAMNKCSIIISLFSTAAFEAYGWGKKVLICNLFNSDEFQIPIAEICLVNEPDYETFSRKLTNLINMSESEYREKTMCNTQYLMVHNQDKPAHVVIRETILSTLHS